MVLAYYAAGAGALALLFALFTMSQVLKESMGTPKMKQLSEAVQEGAMAYMNRQYKTLIPFAIIKADKNLNKRPPKISGSRLFKAFLDKIKSLFDMFFFINL